MMTAKVRSGLGCLFALALVFVASPAAAARTRTVVCGQRQQIVDFLASNFHEARESMGLSSTGMLLELFVSSTGTWTIIMSAPNGTSCIVDAGNSWDRDKPGPLPTGREA